jgi:hypothetical protein
MRIALATVSMSGAEDGIGASVALIERTAA